MGQGISTQRADGMMTCEACDKPFDPAGVAPGSKIACPYCGDVQVVPGRA
ncbi:MAG: hypothetical protein JNJ48_03500, partial [Phycisphaerae bacterium]|nr:hypothetical protein [Phycisphaerae bacterium]